MSYIVQCFGHYIDYAVSFLTSPISVATVKQLSLILSLLVGCEVANGAFCLYAPFDYTTFYTTLDTGASELAARTAIHLCGNSTLVFGVEHLRDGAVAVAHSCNLTVFSITPTFWDAFIPERIGVFYDLLPQNLSSIGPAPTVPGIAEGWVWAPMEQVYTSGFSYAPDPYLRIIPTDEPERYQVMLEALRTKFQLPLERLTLMTLESDETYFRARVEAACLEGTGWSCRIQKHVYTAEWHQVKFVLPKPKSSLSLKM